MARQPKRLPGEPNPEAQPLELDDFVRNSGVANGTGSYWMANGTRNGDSGIGRSISALIDRRKRRKASKSRNAECPQRHPGHRQRQIRMAESLRLEPGQE